MRFVYPPLRISMRFLHVGSIKKSMRHFQQSMLASVCMMARLHKCRLFVYATYQKFPVSSQKFHATITWQQNIFHAGGAGASAAVTEKPGTVPAA